MPSCVSTIGLSYCSCAVNFLRQASESMDRMNQIAQARLGRRRRPRETKARAPSLAVPLGGWNPALQPLCFLLVLLVLLPLLLWGSAAPAVLSTKTPPPTPPPTPPADPSPPPQNLSVPVEGSTVLLLTPPQRLPAPVMALAHRQAAPSPPPLNVLLLMVRNMGCTHQY